MSDAPSNGFTTVIKGSDKGPFLVRRDYAEAKALLKNRIGDTGGKETMITFDNNDDPEAESVIATETTVEVTHRTIPGGPYQQLVGGIAAKRTICKPKRIKMTRIEKAALLSAAAGPGGALAPRLQLPAPGGIDVAGAPGGVLEPRLEPAPDGIDEAEFNVSVVNGSLAASP